MNEHVLLSYQHTVLLGEHALSYQYTVLLGEINRIEVLRIKDNGVMCLDITSLWTASHSDDIITYKEQNVIKYRKCLSSSVAGQGKLSTAHIFTYQYGPWFSLKWGQI